MLTSKIGVGVAPITSYSGALVSAYLVRTEDAGATWQVTGIFPKGFYPWTTAFVTTEEGYVINGTGVLFTKDAGRTWAKVNTSGGPLSISVKGDVVWIPVENCGINAMQGPCSTHLDSYSVGNFAPSFVSSLPTDQPVLAQVGSSVGYSIGSGGISGSIYLTSNSGSTWRSIANPCHGHQISGASVASRSALFIYCELGPNDSPGPTFLFSSINGGASWRKVSTSEGVGLDGSVGSTGRFLWAFGPTLWESSNGGRLWTDVPEVKYGPSGNISTYGASEAWHAVPGKGIYRTLNGTTWMLLK